MADTTNLLVTAETLQKETAIPKGTSYKLAKSGLIPSYKVGPRMHGVRFIISEVLTALKRPAPATQGDDSAQ